MRGKRISVLGRPSDVAWTGLLPGLARAAGIEGQQLDTSDDHRVVERGLEEGHVEVLAVCDDAVIGGPELERLVEVAGANRACEVVLVEEKSGHRPMVDAVSRRTGRVELEFGRPLAWVVRTGEVPPGEAAAQLWLRSIYRPSVFDAAELPPHPAHDLYWDEVRRQGEARPPR